MVISCSRQQQMSNSMQTIPLALPASQPVASSASLNAGHLGTAEIKVEPKEETKSTFHIGGLLDGREEKVNF